MVLVIDIGGTTTRVALCDCHSHGGILPETLKCYNSSQYNGIEAIIQEYGKAVKAIVRHAVMGIAGPVASGIGTATNLPWVLDAAMLKSVLRLENVWLLNDVEALAYSIEGLGDSDVKSINAGIPDPGAPIAVIAPGTGLGEAFLVSRDLAYYACPSEGGHADFAPTDPTETRLLCYLANRFGHVSYERVCSGPGLCNIYDFLRDESVCSEPGWVKNALMNAQDRAAMISQIALSERDADSIAVRAVTLFVRILGAEAGNMALRYAAGNGVYIGGGIVPKLLPLIDRTVFMESFSNKGRLAGFVRDIPVRIILNHQANLSGLACFARQHMNPG